MNDTEKLRVLIPHWIEHNQEHASEFENWAEKEDVAANPAIAQKIRQAADLMKEGNAVLHAALHELGGELHQADDDHQHHHHNHHHHTH